MTLCIFLGRSRNDGWTIATDLGSDRIAITTRDKRNSPNGIGVGHNLNKNTDDTFRIACSGGIDDQASEIMFAFLTNCIGSKIALVITAHCMHYSLASSLAAMEHESPNEA